MSTATTVGTTSVNVPANYDFIEPAPYDAPGSASFGKKTDGAICHVTLAPVGRDAALPFGDAQAVIDDIHENLDDDQGLIEVDTGTTTAGHAYIYSIVRTNMGPGNEHYGLKLHIDTGTDAGVIGAVGAFDTLGVSSYRDSYVFSKLDRNNARIMEGWFMDPYDPSFIRGNPMNHSELPEYDDDFPDHPLTLVRRFVRELVENN